MADQSDIETELTNQLVEAQNIADRFGRALATMLVACGIAKPGEMLELDRMESLSEQYGADWAALVQRGEDGLVSPLEGLVGAILPLSVQGRPLALLDRRLNLALVRARLHVELDRKGRGHATQAAAGQPGQAGAALPSREA